MMLFDVGQLEEIGKLDRGLRFNDPVHVSDVLDSLGSDADPWCNSMDSRRSLFLPNTAVNRSRTGRLGVKAIDSSITRFESAFCQWDVHGKVDG